MNPSNLLQKHLRHYASIPAHSIGVVAVSGGADSMALLHALMILQRKRPFSLYAATFDHGLRGVQSAEEAAGVATVCAEWGIPHFLSHGAVDPTASGVEARARTARYTFLAGVARQVGADWVATGHHADDQAETVLMHLIRGAGLRGLRGMRPVAPLPTAPALTLLRPLLGVRHADITAYCEYHHIRYYHDSTNDDPAYRRNWVRITALPLLAQVNPDVSGALNRFAEAAALDDDFIESVAAPIKEATTFTTHRAILPRWMLSTLHIAVRIRAIEWVCTRLSSTEPPTFDQLRAAAALVDGDTGKKYELSGGLQARLEHDSLMIEQIKAASIDVVPGRFGLTAGASYWLNVGEWRKFPGGAAVRAIAETGLGVVDFYVQEGQILTLRTPIQGERIRPLNLGGHTKKLKDWLIDHKIPQRWRSRLPVLAVDDTVVAIWDGTDWHRFWSESPPNHSLTMM